MKKRLLAVWAALVLAHFSVFLVAPTSAATIAIQTEDDEDAEPVDVGLVDDGDGDPVNDDVQEVEPDADDLTSWSDAADGEYEQRAAQVDGDDYMINCRDKAACQATLDYIGQQLGQLLLDYARHSNPRRQEAPRVEAFSGGKARAKSKNGETRYHVLAGQTLERFRGKVGRNDQLLWDQVLRVVPRAQSDRLFSGFSVYRKKSDDLLAFVEGDPDGSKFRMAINESTHLATDLREQYLTVTHEFMHMVDFDQFIPDDGGIDQEAIPQDDTARRVSVKSILDQLFPAESDDPLSTNVVPDCSGVRDGDGCYPKGTIRAGFVRKFWTENDLLRHKDEDYYAKNQSRYVTEYATSAPQEDIAESFSYWVITEGKGSTVADAKQRYFGRFPQLVALKDHIRRAVIAEILKSMPGRS